MIKLKKTTLNLYLPPGFSKDRMVDVTYSALKSRNLNLGLFFDKYILWEKDIKSEEIKCGIKTQMELLKIIYENPQKAKDFLKNENEKEAPIKLSFSLDLQYFPYMYYEMYRKRLELIMDNIEQEGYYVEYLPNKSSGVPLKWRLAINLGRSSVYETSYIFHRNYSIPYIPGSAIKGVARHWSMQKFSDDKHHPVELDRALENGENQDIKAGDITFSDLIKIFGSKKERGNVIFFDALPYFDDLDKANKVNVSVLDVINVHYPSYYQSGKVPGDWDNPNPVFFLAIEKGIKFRFALASKNRDLAVKARALLEEAISKFGVGAKSSAGYGYFKAVQS